MQFLRYVLKMDGNCVRERAECQNITYLRLFKRINQIYEPGGMNFIQQKKHIFCQPNPSDTF